MKNTNSNHPEYESVRFVIDSYFPDKKEGVMIEVGAALPDSLSISEEFKEREWRCICIEPIPWYAERHREAGNEIYEIAASNYESESENFDVYTSMANGPDEGMSFSGLSGRANPPGNVLKKTIEVKVSRLDKILDDANAEKIDFISVDVEGWELEVMQGLTNPKYLAPVIMLENLRDDVMQEIYMKGRGYELIKKIGYNHIYEKASKFFPLGG